MINDVVSVPWRLQNVMENHGGNYVLEKGSLLHVDKVALTQEMTNVQDMGWRFRFRAWVWGFRFVLTLADGPSATF